MLRRRAYVIEAKNDDKFTVLGVKGDYASVMSRPTSRVKAERMRKVLSPMPGETNVVMTVGDAKKKFPGRKLVGGEYLDEAVGFLGESISQEKIKRGGVRGKGEERDFESGAARYGLEAKDLIGWFASKHNMAFGWSIFETTPEEKAEFGDDAKRTYSGRTRSMSIAKFNLVKGTYAFLDNKAYEDGVVKYQRPSPYNRIRIENTPRAARAFKIV